MAAEFDDAAVVQHRDLVGIADRREAVGDHDARPAVTGGVQRSLHHLASNTGGVRRHLASNTGGVRRHLASKTGGVRHHLANNREGEGLRPQCSPFPPPPPHIRVGAWSPCHCSPQWQGWGGISPNPPTAHLFALRVERRCRLVQ